MPVTPSTVPTSSPESTLVPTATIIPTLAVDDARKKLLALLLSNGNCRLPCFWGITPGQTTYQEAKSILIPLSSISDFTVFDPGGGSITLYYAEDNFKTDLNIALLTTKNIIDRISFRGQEFEDISNANDRGAFSIFDSEIFGKRMAFYTLPNILTNYGRPSSVLLSTLAEIPPSRYGQGHFRILVLYPDQGIIIRYTTEMQVIGSNVVGCTSNAHLEFKLFPPGNSADYQELLASSMWLYLSDYKPIEDVTSMNIEDFYQKFKLPNDNCIYTPVKYWPIPEK